MISVPHPGLPNVNVCTTEGMGTHLVCSVFIGVCHIAAGKVWRFYVIFGGKLKLIRN